jgi:hypothetical protein
MEKPPLDHPRHSPVAEVDDEGLLIPPWVKYPNIRRGTHGWEAGYGGEYMSRFHEWWGAQPADVRGRAMDKYKDAGEWSGFWKAADKPQGRGSDKPKGRGS